MKYSLWILVVLVATLYLSEAKKTPNESSIKDDGDFEFVNEVSGMLFQERSDVCIFKFRLMFKGALRNEKERKCFLASFPFRDVKNGYDDVKQAHQKKSKATPSRFIINDVLQYNFLLKAHLYSRNFGAGTSKKLLNDIDLQKKVSLQACKGSCFTFDKTRR